jgi:hypothetical protein
MGLHDVRWRVRNFCKVLDVKYLADYEWAKVMSWSRNVPIEMGQTCGDIIFLKGRIIVRANVSHQN